MQRRPAYRTGVVDRISGFGSFPEGGQGGSVLHNCDIVRLNNGVVAADRRDKDTKDKRDEGDGEG